MAYGVEVYLWKTKIGTLVQENVASVPEFMYDSQFVKSGIEVSPIEMPLSSQIYSFPNLNEKTFYGLPGMLADSLPDKFGTRLLGDYLARQGRLIEQLTAVERLCYVGNRGMGALEYVPQKNMYSMDDRTIDIDDMSRLADRILSERSGMHVQADEQAIAQLIEVGTTAGGARAKALIAWNESAKDIRSGQIEAGQGYSYWLLKFGSISNNKDKDSKADNMEYPKIEYAYSLMAKDAGIDMSECRMIKSSEGIHFMTLRFDRDMENGKKIHMQSLGGIAHYDFNDPGAYSYEHAVTVMRNMGLLQNDVEQLFRRMVFNEVSKNYDDHVKNISFLMNRQGEWSLAPAYDMTFAYEPTSIWTSSHQMKINEKRDSVSVDDLIQSGRNMDISDRKIRNIIKEVYSVVAQWEHYAEYVGLDENTMSLIKQYHKCDDEYIDINKPLVVLEKNKNINPRAYTEIS